MNRIWQCGTIQLDMNLPERFDLTYISESGDKVRPIMLHRALFGSIERFIGILIEHFAGVFPLWLAPEQIKVIPVNNLYHLDYAKEVLAKLQKLGIRASIDDRNEKMNYKIREAQTSKIPYTLVLGDKETAEGLITYRVHGEQKSTTLNYDEFVEMLQKELSPAAKN
jgi:threonyl-tRNA synthetase